MNKLENACYYASQKSRSSCLLPETPTISIYDLLWNLVSYSVQTT
jgi:hypothetical protein